MKHIKTLKTRNLCESAKNGGCGECQTSCQSACKTSCGIANQKCENAQKESKQLVQNIGLQQYVATLFSYYEKIFTYKKA